MAARLVLANGRVIDGTGASPRDGWSAGEDALILQQMNETLEMEP